MISINTNPSVLTIQRNISKSSNALYKALERMSTGYKINSAKDDAAGLYVATKLNTQIRGLMQAKINTENGMVLINTAADALSNMQNILNRLRDLAVQSSNGIYDNESRNAMQAEADSLVEELYRIKNSTQYNGMCIFEDTAATAAKMSDKIFTNLNKNAKASDTPDFINKVTSVNEAPDGYIGIYTAEDLSNINNTGNYILMNDIDLSGFGNWKPIEEFSGILDGNGYKISNLTIKDDSDKSKSEIGLFKNLKGAEIKNLGITDANINIKNADNVGILAGYTEDAEVTNCYATGVINNESVNGSANNSIGGLLGQLYKNTTVKMSYSNANVKATNSYYVGGLIGSSISYTNKITNSCASGNVEGNDMVGGFSGSVYNSTNCFATGNVKGNTRVGGFTGILNYGSNIYATGTVTGIDQVGGIAGQTSGSAYYMYFSGKVSGVSKVGGIMGYCYGNAYYALWDKEKSGIDVIAGDDPYGYEPGGKGLTTAEMKDASKYKDEGFDTTIWDLSSAPPTFLWAKNFNLPDAYDPNKTEPPESFGGNIRLQIGADDSDYSFIMLDTTFEMNTLNIDFSTAETSIAAIEAIDELIEKINTKNSYFGAVSNRLNSVISLQISSITNYTAARSTIMDADIAEETAIFVKNRILQQTASALLSQAQNAQRYIIQMIIK